MNLFNIHGYYTIEAIKQKIETVFGHTEYADLVSLLNLLIPNGWPDTSLADSLEASTRSEILKKMLASLLFLSNRRLVIQIDQFQFIDASSLAFVS